MDEQVLIETQGGLGIVTLNRPDKINALTPSMIEAIGAALRAWRYDAAVSCVVLRGNGERGFSAGGDLAGFHRALAKGEHEGFLDILAAEFELAAQINSYAKPVVSIMHGLTLGAGFGLAGAAAVRVVTPDARVGMPETRIGYVPDVGGSLLLGRAPGRVGEFMAATADPVEAGDAVESGLADFCIRQDGVDDLLATLQDLSQLGAGEVGVGLEVMHGVQPPRDTFSVTQSRSWIDHCFAPEELADILHELDHSAWPAAHAAAERIRGNSPLAVATAIEVVRAARDEDEMRGCLEREHRAASFLMGRPDLSEGIRARIIDKDGAPRWDPADPSDVDVEAIRSMLEPEEDEEW